jgi:CheY-like chemotaxis protein
MRDAGYNGLILGTTGDIIGKDLLCFKNFKRNNDVNLPVKKYPDMINTVKNSSINRLESIRFDESNNNQISNTSSDNITTNVTKKNKLLYNDDIYNCPNGTELEINDKKLLRVLVVDDSSSNRKLLCRLLQGKYMTVEAEDGLIALNIILESMKGNSNSFDIVLMDYQMPNMDGPTSVKRMRDAGYNGLIIGITGNALEKDLLYFKNSGLNEVFTKPVKLSQLEDVIYSKY